MNKRELNCFLKVYEYKSIKNDMLLESEVSPTVLRVLSTPGMLKYLKFDFIETFYAGYPNIRLNIVEYPENHIECIGPR